MKLTIIETGEVPEALRPGFGTYPEMFAAMMTRHGQYGFETVAVHRSEPLPDPAGLDAVLITGSPAGVYEDHAWLEPLFDFIRAAYRADTPMAGICFGHQAMARALGGVVEKSDKGWGTATGWRTMCSRNCPGQSRWPVRTRTRCWCRRRGRRCS